MNPRGRLRLRRRPTRIWKLKHECEKCPAGCQYRMSRFEKNARGAASRQIVFQFGASRRARSTFLTDCFVFLCRKFTFGGSKIDSEKNQIKWQQQHCQHTYRFELDLEARRTHFRHSKTQIQSRNDSNRGPRSDPQILLRTCLIELLRHPSVLLGFAFSKQRLRRKNNHPDDGHPSDIIVYKEL